MLDECYDMELYEWVKADINDPVRISLGGCRLSSACYPSVCPGHCGPRIFCICSSCESGSRNA